MPRKKKNQRNDKRFCVRLDLGTVEGKRVRKYFYSYESLEDARAKRDEYMKNHSPHTNPSERGITLSQWCEKWLRAYKGGLSANTQNNYRCAVIRFCKYRSFGEREIAEFKHSDIQEYLTSLSGKSKGLVDIAYTTINQVFESAEGNNLIAASPFKKINKPASTYTGHRVIADWERHAIESTWKLHRAGICAMIMLYAGLRRGEMAALTWEDIDFENKIIHVSKSIDLNNKGREKDTKTTYGLRTVPMLRPLLTALKEIAPINKSGYVCTNTTNEKLSINSYRGAWNSYMLVLERFVNGIKPYEKTHGWRKEKDRTKDSHKIVSIDAHDLRYTFASYLYDNDVDVKTAQYLMGHSNIEVTLKIYTKLSDQKKAKSIGSLVDFFDQKSDTHFDTH